MTDHERKLLTDVARQSAMAERYEQRAATLESERRAMQETFALELLEDLSDADADRLVGIYKRKLGESAHRHSAMRAVFRTILSEEWAGMR